MMMLARVAAAKYDKCTMIQVERHISMDDIQNLVKGTKVLNGAN